MINKIYVAGHKGMVGSAIMRKLSSIETEYKVLIADKEDLDLRDHKAVLEFIKINRPDCIIIAAARVGGILANRDNPYTFIMDNLQIQNNLIEGAIKYKVKKVIFLGSSCIYPKMATQPIKEEYLLTGPLEETNQWYAIAKIAGVKAIEAARANYGLDYSSLMPTNLYGINDNFDLETSHVIPAMIRKIHEAKLLNRKTVELWGDGTPMREFLNVDDLANAVYTLIRNKSKYSLYNVGSEKEIKLVDLANKIKSIIGFQGEIIWNTKMPNGTPRKLMDSSRFKHFDWKAKISLDIGLEKLYHWYIDNPHLLKKNKPVN